MSLSQEFSSLSRNGLSPEQPTTTQADKDLFGDDCDGPAGGGKGGAGGAGGGGGGGSEPDSDDEDDNVETPDAIRRRAEREAFKLREVFLSRQMETLPATLIRGKCSVTLLSEVETPASYTGRSDAFFYSLVYDPHQKSLVSDCVEISRPRWGGPVQRPAARWATTRREHQRGSPSTEFPRMRSSSRSG